MKRDAGVLILFLSGSLSAGSVAPLWYATSSAAESAIRAPDASASPDRRAAARGEFLVTVSGRPRLQHFRTALRTDDPEVDRVLEAVHATSVRRVGGLRRPRQIEDKAIYVVRIPDTDSVEQALARAPRGGRILAIEPNFLLEVTGSAGATTLPNDPRFNEQWALPRIAAPQAWSVEQGNSSAVIGVIDTGVDYDHPDLAANIWVNEAEMSGIPGVDDDSNGFVDDVRGYDFVTATNVAPGEDPAPPDADPMDGHGHGTHVSGIAAAVADNATGIAGVAWRSRIMALRAGYKEPSGFGVLQLSDIVDAIYYAIENGADILNMSFGGGSSAAVATALADARAAGILLVAAAGNSGREGPFYPAALPGVLAVAATDSLDAVPAWSNFGSWVDVCAPGNSILSTILDDTYTRFSGTSMAAPHVAGIAALVLSHRPLLSAEQLATAIRSTCQTPNAVRFVGIGRVNADLAVNYQASVVARLDQKKTIQGLGREVFQVLGTASGTSYQVMWGEGSYPTVWTTVTTGTTVIDGVLATFDPAVLPHDGEYCLRLVASDAVGQPGEDRWYFRYDSELRAGWPRAISSSDAAISVAVADVLGNGSKWIIACSLDGYVHVWDSAGTEAPGWPKKIKWGGAIIDASPACADLDGDGDLEIVLATVTEGIQAWRIDGTPMPGWPKTFPWPQRPFASVSIGNLDADPMPEIVGSVLDPTVLYAWNADGSLLPGWPRTFPGDWHAMATTALADIDDDGVDEIVFVPWTLQSGNQTAVHLMDASGTELTGWPVILPGGTYSSPAVGDVDGDGVRDITVAAGTQVHLLDLQGQTKAGWPQNLLTSADRASPSIGSLVPNGPLKIGMVTICDWFWLLGPDGALATGWPVIQSSGCLISNIPHPSPLFADLDGDGLNELVVGRLDGGGLMAWTSAGTLLPGWPKFMGATGVPSTATVADIDGDGSAELLCGGGNGLLYVWNLGIPYVARNGDWQSLHHDIRNTRCLDCPRSLVSVEPLIASSARLRIEAVYPRPSRGEIHLRFVQRATNQVELEVYDLTGRLIKRARSGPSPPGRNSISWDGRGAGGTPVATGVYVLRLRAGAEWASARALVLR